MPQTFIDGRRKYLCTCAMCILYSKLKSFKYIKLCPPVVQKSICLLDSMGLSRQPSPVSVLCGVGWRVTAHICNRGQAESHDDLANRHDVPYCVSVCHVDRQGFYFVLLFCLISLHLAKCHSPDIHGFSQIFLVSGHIILMFCLLKKKDFWGVLKVWGHQRSPFPPNSNTNL